MNKIIQFAASNALAVLALLILVSGLAATYLPDLKVQVSAQGLIAEDDPAQIQYQRILDTYGSADSVAVVIRDDDLFSLPVLGAIQNVHEQLMALPFVTGIDSLFTLDDVKNIEGDIRFSPYLAELPASDEQASAIKASALLNPFIQGNLLSADGKTMALNVRLKSHADLVNESIAIDDLHIVQQIDRLIRPLDSDVDEVFAFGLPYVLGGLSGLISVDQKSILPLSMLALLLVLLFTLRRMTAVILPFMTASMSVIWTLGVMAAFGVPVSIMTSIVPALLVVIGSTEDIHLLSAWYRAREEGKSREQAIASMSSSTGLAILLTFVTTYLGFLSIALNDITLLQEFGLVASSGLLINFIITTLLAPAILSFGGSEPVAVTEEKSKLERVGIYDKLAEKLFKIVNKNRIPVLLGTAFVTIFALYWTSNIQVDNDNMSFFNQQAPIHYKSKMMHQQLAGVQSLDIVLTSPIQDTFLKVRYLEEVQKLQQYLNDTKQFDKTTSFVDYVKLINNVMDDDLDPGEMYLPEDDGLVREYMLYVDPEKTRPYINSDFSETRIVVRHNISSSHELKKLLEDIEEFSAENILPGLQLILTGDAVLSKKAADRMVEGQVTSLLFMLFVIIFIISILFLDFKAGLVAAIPNLVPVILLFGVMGFFEIPLNTGTAMVAAIAIGICVDDTMHFLVSYNQEMRHHERTEDGILAAMKHEARPILSTSMALALGFGVLAFSNFPPVVHFGLLSALVIVFAVIANFILVPVLLSYVRIVTIWDVLNVHLQSELIDNCLLFTNMRPFEVKKLIAMSERHTFEVDDSIIKQGDVGDEVFVVLSGKVGVRVPYRRKEDAGKYRVAASLGSGAVFGEIGFLGEVTRTADVFAEEKTEVLSLRTRGIARLSRFLPRTASKLYYNLSKILAQRLA